jgi:hypothetical protein
MTSQQQSIDQRASQLRDELKVWEKQFATAHGGRKAAKADIKADATIGTASTASIGEQSIDRRNSGKVQGVPQAQNASPTAQVLPLRSSHATKAIVQFKSRSATRHRTTARSRTTATYHHTHRGQYCSWRRRPANAASVSVDLARSHASEGWHSTWTLRQHSIHHTSEDWQTSTRRTVGQYCADAFETADRC